MQLASAAVSHADERVFIGSGTNGRYGDTGSGYKSADHPVEAGTYDKIYGGRIATGEVASKSVTGNVLNLDLNHTISNNGRIYGGCYINENNSSLNSEANWEVVVGANDTDDKDVKDKNKNSVTVQGTKFEGAAAIYGGYAANVCSSGWSTVDAQAQNAAAGHSLAASSNTATVSKITGATAVEIYGGYAANVGIGGGASATSSGTDAAANFSFTASGNTAAVSKITGAATVKAYGGFAANFSDTTAYAGVTSYAGATTTTEITSRHRFTASNNTAQVSEIEGAKTVEVYGGFAANFSNKGTAHASVTAKNYSYHKEASSSASHSFTASGNTATVFQITCEDAADVKVYGGYAANVADVSSRAENSVKVEINNCGGAEASCRFTALDNTVDVSDIEGAKTVEVYGGCAESYANPATGKATVKPYVEVTDSAKADQGSRAAASHAFTATHNTVRASNVKASESVKIYGGRAENAPVLSKFAFSNKGNTVQITESAEASRNEVYLTNVDATEVCGGYSSVTLSKNSGVNLNVAFDGVTIKGTSEASNNKVELHGGSFTGSDLYVGYSKAVVLQEEAETGSCSFEGTAASASVNTLALYAYEGASPRLDGAVLWGGFAEVTVNGKTSAGTTTGNILEFHEVKGMTAKNIKNFSELKFVLPVMAAGEAVLTLTDADGTDISNATVKVENGIIGVSGDFKEDDEIVLLKNDNGLATDGVTPPDKKEFNGQPDAATTTILAQKGISLQYELEFQTTGTSIVLKCTDVTKTVQKKDAGTGKDDGAGKLLPQTKAVAEGAAAGLALASEAANAGIELANSFFMPANSIAPFVHVQGSSVTHETGSSVHLSSVSLAAGIGTGLETGAGKLSAGAFFEYGKGSYTTSNSFDNAPSVNGDGTSWYMGGGILAKMDFIPTGPGHFYVQGSAHMGQLHNEYDSSDLRDAGGRIAKFDLDSPYYSLHGGLGYVWNITEGHDVDVYGRYIWTRVQGTDDTLTTGDKFEFDDMDSSRVRFGARYTYKGNERFRPYVGAAYEHEFAGSCESTAYGYDVAAPSFEGDTGMGELGITMTPSESLPLSVNLGVQGYVGKKQGVSGNCMVKYEF